MSPARTRGSITLELMIALAVFVMLLGSAELLLWGATGAGSIGAADELALARTLIGSAEADARTDFFSVVSSSSESIRNGSRYALSLAVTEETSCVKGLRASVGAPGAGTTTLSALITDPEEEASEGDDCAAVPLQEDWESLARASSSDIAGAHARALDALLGSVYVGTDAPPYLAVADEASGALIPFRNGFSLPAAVNALDAAMVEGKPYVFAALNATSSQFAVIDMRDAAAPVADYFTLAGVDPSGESPQGYRVKYYGGYAYASARYTAGPELHIFDVSDPHAAYEAASAELGVTINDFAVREEGAEGKRFLYAASSDKPGELTVYDVTQPWRASLLSRTDLPEKTSTHHPAESIALYGHDLIIGRSSGPNDPDLFIYDASDPAHPALVGSADPGATVSGIEAFGDTIFIGTTKSGKQIQVWDIAAAAHPAFAASYALAGLAALALDYDRGRLYAGGGGAPLLEILEP